MHSEQFIGLAVKHDEIDTHSVQSIRQRNAIARELHALAAEAMATPSGLMAFLDLLDDDHAAGWVAIAALDNGILTPPQRAHCLATIKRLADINGVAGLKARAWLFDHGHIDSFVAEALRADQKRASLQQAEM